MKLHRKDMALLLGSLLVAGIVPAAAFFFVPGLIEMFSYFPERWPIQTRILFSYYQLSLLFPPLVAIAWYFWPKLKNRSIVVFLLSCVGAAMLCALGWWAMTPQELVLGAIKGSYP